MIELICGEDFVRSRELFIQFKNKYRLKNYEIKEIAPEQIPEYYLNWKNQQNLFFQKICFVSQNLPKRLINKKEFKKILNNIASDKEVIFLIWEQKITAKDLNYPKNTKISEIKPDTNIFKFLDSLYPNNKKSALYLLSKIKTTNEESFIFYMVVKRIKQLIEVKINLKTADLQIWQLKRLKSQSLLWSSNQLMLFYHNLYKIDLLLKTSNTPFSLINSLEILICYLL